MGLRPPEPLGEGRPDLHYLLLGDDAFALMCWLLKPYSHRQLTRDERIVNLKCLAKGQRSQGRIQMSKYFPHVKPCFKSIFLMFSRILIFGSGQNVIAFGPFLFGQSFKNSLSFVGFRMFFPKAVFSYNFLFTIFFSFYLFIFLFEGRGWGLDFFKFIFLSSKYFKIIF